MTNLTRQKQTGLGATLTSTGVAFSVFSSRADAMELCLFDPDQPELETARVRMVQNESEVWEAFVPGLSAGALYGYRAYGPWSPQDGLYFNPRKLLLDPYAKAIHGGTNWQPAFDQFEEAYHTQSLVDSGASMPKGVVIDPASWTPASPRLGRPWSETMVYEMHVRGFSKLNLEIPEELRGTYAGLAHPASLRYLNSLGITAVQLLPVHWHVDDAFLLKRNLTNYWGYNTLSFFVPHPEYASRKDPQAQLEEFRDMVEALHGAGIEVILDVVYNHTAEGGETGITMSYRGLDNPAYYLLQEHSLHENYTGCGNTVNLASAPALQLTLDSLRYWVEVMGVDGFRFDLGVTMGRMGAIFAPQGPFFMAVQQDPVLREVKMIAEPWDMGPNGYQVGGFPKPWRELNGRFRDDVRRFWCGDPHILPDFAKRFCGSQDLYGAHRRGPLASVNFLTSHDGFTLRDLWTYHEKRNHANGENNQDGDNQNHSWNAGVEGETEDPNVNHLRQKLARAALGALFLSKGVPFLTMGDEKWRTQHGNNNAYCQDQDWTALSWEEDGKSQAMLRFVSKLIQVRQTLQLWDQERFLDGAWDAISETHDVRWFDEQSEPMDHGKWHDQERRFVAAFGRKRKKLHPSEHSPESWWLLFNGSDVNCDYPIEGEWEIVIDSARGDVMPNASVIGNYRCEARAMVCLVQQ